VPQPAKVVTDDVVRGSRNRDVNDPRAKDRSSDRNPAGNGGNPDKMRDSGGKPRVSLPQPTVKVPRDNSSSTGAQNGNDNGGQRDERREERRKAREQEAPVRQAPAQPQSHLVQPGSGVDHRDVSKDQHYQNHVELKQEKTERNQPREEKRSDGGR